MKRLLPVRRLLVVVGWIMVVVASYIVSSLVAAIIARVLGLAGIELLALHIVVLLMMVGLVFLSPWLIGRPAVSLSDAALGRVLTWKDLLWGVLGFAGYLGIMTLVAPVIDKVAWFNTSQPQEFGFGLTTSWTLFLGCIVLVIATPFLEESLFRGVLQGKLRQSGLSFAATALIVATLFGAAHGQWNVGIDVFFMSLVSSYIREKTGSLWPSIVLHITKNGLAFYIAFVVLGGGIH
jgi:membrane protease YdiL (CAAX protease family)